MGFLATVSAAVIEWALDKSAQFVFLFIKERKAESEAESQASKTEKQVESAKTPEQKSAAADSVSSDLVK